jgi:adenylate cyclase
MGVEIERKFLVVGDGWRRDTQARDIRQGYVCAHRERAVRVRIFGDAGFLCVKGERKGIERAEYEYPIPLADATEMLERLCQPPLIEKTRYTVDHTGVEWVVDEFRGDNAGLIVAEVELDSVDEAVSLPAWAGREVTDDPRFLNVNLAARPFVTWSAEERAAIVG